MTKSRSKPVTKSAATKVTKVHRPIDVDEQAEASTSAVTTASEAPTIREAVRPFYAQELPDVTIQVCTYDRFQMLIDNIKRLNAVIRYPAEHLYWLICDDSSPNNYTERVAAALYDEGFQNYEVISTPERGGWGRNVNNGLRQIATPYTFFIEDDYWPKRWIPLDAAVALMEAKPGIGMIRFRGTAGTHAVYHGFEADISAFMPEYMDGYGVPGKVQYLQLDGGSPTVYLYSHGAHLKRSTFHDFYGPYPENLKLGQTEEAYAHTVKDKMRADPNNAPAIAIFPEFVINWFDHVGTSYQHGPLDTANATAQG